MLLLDIIFFLYKMRGLWGKFAIYIFVNPFKFLLLIFFGVVSCSSRSRVLPPSAILSVFLSVFLMNRGYSFSYSGP